MSRDYKFDQDEAAAYLGISVRTLQNWRGVKGKPKYYKPTNKLVYYYKSDLDEWIKNQNERI